MMMPKYQNLQIGANPPTEQLQEQTLQKKNQDEEENTVGVSDDAVVPIPVANLPPASIDDAGSSISEDNCETTVESTAFPLPVYIRSNTILGKICREILKVHLSLLTEYIFKSMTTFFVLHYFLDPFVDSFKRSSLSPIQISLSLTLFYTYYFYPLITLDRAFSY